MEVGRLALTLVELSFFVNAAAELPDQVVGVGIAAISLSRGLKKLQQEMIYLLRASVSSAILPTILF
jgi:hypothetical protein